jgi:hypothetical protein
MMQVVGALIFCGLSHVNAFILYSHRYKLLLDLFVKSVGEQQANTGKGFDRDPIYSS